MNLSDAEIIKALERCNKTNQEHKCLDCPYYCKSAICLRNLMNDALDLINRQQKLIDRLKASNKNCGDKILNQREQLKATNQKIKEQQAEIKCLQEIIFKKEDLMQMLGTQKQVYYDELVSAKAENERLKTGMKKLVDKQRLYKENVQATREFQIEQAKTEAVKEFAEKIEDEIAVAIINNGIVIEKREKKYNVNRYEDDVCIMCDSKIMALGGIKWFINNLLKEMGVRL